MDLSSRNGTKESTAEHIAVFSAFTEGMQLFSSFIMLLNFPRQGKMKGMGQIVTWSIVDETQHAESMIKLFRTYIEENKEVWNDELKSKTSFNFDALENPILCTNPPVILSPLILSIKQIS